MATGNTTLQLTADPEFRGRVMALWSVTFTGSTPVGGPIVGVVADDLAPRYGLGPSPVCPPPTDTPGAPANSTGPPTSKPTRPAHS